MTFLSLNERRRGVGDGNAGCTKRGFQKENTKTGEKEPGKATHSSCTSNIGRKKREWPSTRKKKTHKNPDASESTHRTRLAMALFGRGVEDNPKDKRESDVVKKSVQQTKRSPAPPSAAEVARKERLKEFDQCTPHGQTKYVNASRREGKKWKIYHATGEIENCKSQKQTYKKGYSSASVIRTEKN